MERIYKKISFHSGEEVRAVVRRHWAYSLKAICITAALVVTALFFMYALLSQGPVGASVFAAILLTAAVYASRELVMWYFTVAIVTTDRIIDMDQQGYFIKIVSEAAMEKIHDVSYMTKGVWQTLLHVGTVYVKTANNGVMLALSGVKDPESISAVLHDLVRDKTGRDVDVHSTKGITSAQKKILTDDVLHHEDLDAYAEFDLDEVIDEYIGVFGEDKLKKTLVDALDDHDDAGDGKR